jgi:HAD superfamily hydrolase (TIGR01549 family)
MTATGTAVLFDVDGTLVDTNWFHTVAWWRALQEAGEDVAMARIHPLIGMGSDKLLQELLGQERDGLSDGHSKHFEPYKGDITAFPKASELLAQVARRGVKVVLATSSKEEDLEDMLAPLDTDGVVDDIVHGGQVEASKPSPDIFETALEHLGLDSETTMVVGDTRWDVEAAGKLGVPCVAVLTGGTSRADLEAAGAVAVYTDVAELLERLDDSPLASLFR